MPVTIEVSEDLLTTMDIIRSMRARAAKMEGKQLSDFEAGISILNEEAVHQLEVLLTERRAAK